MKRLMVYGMMVAIVVACLSFAVNEGMSQETISTTLVIKNDWVNPSQDKGYFSQTFSGYWHYRWFGAGIDVTHAPRNKYFQVQPFVTLNKGPLYVLAGYSGDSSGAEHVQTGVWYVNSFKKLNVLLDIRNFWTVSEKNDGYLDVWFTIWHPVTPISERIFVGTELEYIHYWASPPHNWYFIGPFIGYKLTKNVSIFARLSHEWDICGGKTGTTNRIRLGVKFCF